MVPSSARSTCNKTVMGNVSLFCLTFWNPTLRKLCIAHSFQGAVVQNSHFPHLCSRTTLVRILLLLPFIVSNYGPLASLAKMCQNGSQFTS